MAASIMDAQAKASRNGLEGTRASAVVVIAPHLARTSRRCQTLSPGSNPGEHRSNRTTPLPTSDPSCTLPGRPTSHRCDVGRALMPVGLSSRGLFLWTDEIEEVF